MTKNDLNNYKDLKRQQKKLVRRIMVRHMVFDNIADIIPKDMKIQQDSWFEGEIKIKFKEEKSITVDVFDKLTEKFSRKFRKNPDMYVTQTTLEACWRIYMFDSTVNITFSTSNSEACDVVIKKVEREEFELTGYCKALSEKKYFDN